MLNLVKLNLAMEFGGPEQFRTLTASAAHFKSVYEAMCARIVLSTADGPLVQLSVFVQSVL